jgi:hypothetical protein
MFGPYDYNTALASEVSVILLLLLQVHQRVFIIHSSIIPYRTYPILAINPGYISVNVCCCLKVGGKSYQRTMHAACGNDTKAIRENVTASLSTNMATSYRQDR